MIDNIFDFIYNNYDVDYFFNFNDDNVLDVSESAINIIILLIAISFFENDNKLKYNN